MKVQGFWKDLTFYFLIEAYADVILRAAAEFDELRRKPTERTARLQALALLREEADGLTAQFEQRLGHAFITPLDKEDLLAIFQSLDVLLAAIDKAARGLQYATWEGTETHVQGLAVKVQDAVTASFELASSLRHGYKQPALRSSLASLHRIRKNGDSLYDSALKDLAQCPGITPQSAVTGKEAFDRLLAVLERAVDLARLVARLLVKYA